MIANGSFSLCEYAQVEGDVVVMYLDDHLEAITWFWIIVAAGGVPCILPSLPKDNEQRNKKLEGELLSRRNLTNQSRHLSSRCLLANLSFL